MVEWLGRILDRFGIRPAPSKIEVVTQLSQPSTVEEVRVCLEMAGYLRKFIPNYSPVVAPILNLLCDSLFRSKKARRLKVPWTKPNGDTRQYPHIPNNPWSPRLEQIFPITHGRQQNRSRSRSPCKVQVKPAPGKIEGVAQLSQPSTVEEVRVHLEMAGYLWQFVPNYSSVLAPILDFLCDSRFRSKNGKRLKIP